MFGWPAGPSLSLLVRDTSAEDFFQSLSKALFTSAPGYELRSGHKVRHYEIRGRIGTGAMGTVYRAHDTRLDREVALKFLRPHLSALPEPRKQLLAEARAAAALEHPNVCAVHEIGESEDGQPFIAMSLCEGETLKGRLERQGRLAPGEAARIASQIAGALAAAHRCGIVHRDVKPGNIMLDSDGTAKLLDFGLARAVDAKWPRLGSTAGTVAYMSPEQARGDPLDPRTDLWSLGVVLYEMLTGARPFRGGDDRALVRAVLYEEPEPVAARRPETPLALVRIVERLLRKDPSERYRNADELLADLAAGSPPEAALRRPAAASPLPVRWIARPRAPRILAGAAVVLAAAALIPAFGRLEAAKSL